MGQFGSNGEGRVDGRRVGAGSVVVSGLVGGGTVSGITLSLPHHTLTEYPCGATSLDNNRLPTFAGGDSKHDVLNVVLAFITHFMDFARGDQNGIALV